MKRSWPRSGHSPDMGIPVKKAGYTRTKSDWTGLQSYSKKCVLADKEVPTIHACVIYLFPKTRMNRDFFQNIWIPGIFWLYQWGRRRDESSARSASSEREAYTERIRKCSHSHGRRPRARYPSSASPLRRGMYVMVFSVQSLQILSHSLQESNPQL